MPAGAMPPPDAALRTRLANAVAGDALPLPGAGHTLERWRRLARLAGEDLSLAKLAEAHWDADAILAELQAPRPTRDALWGVWCAEPPAARVQCVGGARLRGTKAWCSGAGLLTHAWVSAWNEAGEPVLAAVDLAQPRVRVTADGWQAVGMADTGSVQVVFDDAAVCWVSAPQAYVQRRGFWAGGIGIAACWWGAARAIAAQVARSCAQAGGASPDVHRLAHLGHIDAAISSSLAALRAAAAIVDSPTPDLQVCALRTRAIVERDCTAVIAHAGRALGAAPLCQDRAFARLMADLPVFLRQSHAERDLAVLGEVLLPDWERTWQL